MDESQDCSSRFRQWIVAHSRCTKVGGRHKLCSQYYLYKYVEVDVRGKATLCTCDRYV